MLWFFFNDTATTEIYTLSLHDALPILALSKEKTERLLAAIRAAGIRERDTQTQGLNLNPDYRYDPQPDGRGDQDRKSTRLNSSHANISYAVFCLKKQEDRFLRRPLAEK